MRAGSQQPWWNVPVVLNSVSTLLPVGPKGEVHQRPFVQNSPQFDSQLNPVAISKRTTPLALLCGALWAV